MTLLSTSGASLHRTRRAVLRRLQPERSRTSTIVPRCQSCGHVSLCSCYKFNHSVCQMPGGVGAVSPASWFVHSWKVEHLSRPVKFHKSTGRPALAHTSYITSEGTPNPMSSPSSTFVPRATPITAPDPPSTNGAPLVPCVGHGEKRTCDNASYVPG